MRISSEAIDAWRAANPPDSPPLYLQGADGKSRLLEADGDGVKLGPEKGR